jgi:hypothetical protein
MYLRVEVKRELLETENVIAPNFKKDLQFFNNLSLQNVKSINKFNNCYF